MNSFYIFDDINKIVDSIRRNDKESYQSTLEWADESISGIITHRAHYEMEKCLIPVPFNDNLWNETPKEIKNGDQEWNFAFARHSILLNLAKAFAYTKEEKYKEEFIRIINVIFLQGNLGF